MENLMLRRSQLLAGVYRLACSLCPSNLVPDAAAHLCQQHKDPGTNRVQGDPLVSPVCESALQPRHAAAQHLAPSASARQRQAKPSDELIHVLFCHVQCTRALPGQARLPRYSF